MNQEVLSEATRNLEQGVSVSSMDRKLAGLAFLFKLRGLVDFTKNFWVRQALKGYRRTQRRDARRPVSFKNLQAIMFQLGLLSAYEVSLFRWPFLEPSG